MLARARMLLDTQTDTLKAEQLKLREVPDRFAQRYCLICGSRSQWCHKQASSTSKRSHDFGVRVRSSKKQ
jgi:hypothetical protein